MCQSKQAKIGDSLHHSSSRPSNTRETGNLSMQENLVIMSAYEARTDSHRGTIKSIFYLLSIQIIIMAGGTSKKRSMKK